VVTSSSGLQALLASPVRGFIGDPPSSNLAACGPATGDAWTRRGLRPFVRGRMGSAGDWPLARNSNEQRERAACDGRRMAEAARSGAPQEDPRPHEPPNKGLSAADGRLDERRGGKQQAASGDRGPGHGRFCAVRPSDAHRYQNLPGGREAAGSPLPGGR
jgi:hypothetical protein